MVGVHGMRNHGVVGQLQLMVEGLDVGASPSKVCVYEAVPPFAGGVVIGEVSVAKLVDEIRWALKVGKGHWMCCLKWFKHFFLEH